MSSGFATVVPVCSTWREWWNPASTKYTVLYKENCCSELCVSEYAEALAAGDLPPPSSLSPDTIIRHVLNRVIAEGAFSGHDVRALLTVMRLPRNNGLSRSHARIATSASSTMTSTHMHICATRARIIERLRNCDLVVSTMKSGQPHPFR